MSERLRVLTLIKGLGPGGAEQLALSAARVRDRAHFDEEVAYVVPREPTLAPDFEKLGLELHYLGVRNGQDLRWLTELRRLLGGRRYDVVHVHSPYIAGMTRLMIRTMSRRSRPRLVSTEHNVWSRHARPTRMLNASTFALGDAWLAVSEEVRSSVPRVLRDRVEVVVQGIALSDVTALAAQRARIRAELGLRPDELAVVTIANYRTQKGYPDLFQAARQLRERQVPARFLVIGQGPLEAEIASQHARLGLEGYVDLLGYRSDAVRVAAGCDLFVLASHFEGLPVAIMEAFAVGLPVVATRVGGVPEAVRDGVEGLIVPPHRPDLLAHAIERLAVDTDGRAAMSRAATQRAQAYDIASSVRRTETIYRDVCGRPRA